MVAKLRLYPLLLPAGSPASARGQVREIKGGVCEGGDTARVRNFRIAWNQEQVLQLEQ